MLRLDTSDVTFDEKSELQVFYNRSLGDGVQHFPIRINNAYPNFENARIKIVSYAVNQLLPTEEEELPIARFENSDPSELKNKCNELRKHLDGGSGFAGSGECINATTDEVNAYNLVTKKQEKKSKKGLSGGAIAGIVIACVVVVAAIIALLVYFLVIKKNNQSTASTQGDSSIAI